MFSIFQVPVLQESQMMNMEIDNPLELDGFLQIDIDEGQVSTNALDTTGISENLNDPLITISSIQGVRLVPGQSSPQPGTSRKRIMSTDKENVPSENSISKKS
jgi:hypothetical protein